MKAIFLNNLPERNHYVWGEAQVKRLKTLVELRDDAPFSREQVLAGGFEDVEAAFTTWGMPPMTDEEIARCLPSLKAVFYAAGSVQAFARPFLERGVRVFSAWHANGVPVAEFTFSQIALALKGYFQVQAATRQSRRRAVELFNAYPGAYDVKVGLLGCGAVGSLVAERLKTLDCETLVYDPYLPEERAASLGARKASLEEIFETCDVISNHTPNLPSTVGLMKRKHFMSMKPMATFINTGRGPQLDEKDLYDALKEKPTRTALLDVMTDEKNSDTNPLNTLPNCFITPHIAGSAGHEVRRMAEYMMDAFVQFRDGEKCPHEVFIPMLESMA